MESEPGRSQQQSNQNSYLISRSVEAPNSLAPDDSLFQSLEPFLNSDFWQLEYQRGKKLTELPKRAVPIERELPNGHVQSMQPVNQTNGGSNNNFFSRREPTNQRSKKPRPLSYQGQFDHLFPMKLEENIDKCDYSDSKSFTKPSTYDVMSQSYYQPTNNRHYATLNPRFPQKNQITSEFSQCMSQSYHPEYYDNVDLEQFSSPPLDYRSVKTQKNEQKMENFNQNGQLIETYDNWPVSDPQSVTSPEKVQKSQQQMPNEPGGLSNCNQNGYLNQIGQNSHDDHWPFNNSSQQNQSPRKSQLKQSPNYRSLADLSGRTTPTIVEMGPVRKPEAVGVWNPPLHHPHTKLVHAQYNSPMRMYTPENVADMIEKQTGTKLQWQKKPHVRFLNDISDSPTYQFLQELEHRRPPSRAGSEEPRNQSRTFRHLSRHYGTQN